MHVGDLVWRNSDAALERALRGAANRPIGASVAQATREDGGAGSTAAETYRSGAADVSVSVSGGLGQPLHVRVVDVEGRVGEATSEASFQPARSSPLTSDALRAAVGAMGGEGLVLASLDDSNLAGLVRDDDGGGAEGGGAADKGDGSASERGESAGDGLFMPTKVIKATRRAAVDELLRARRDHGRAEGMRAAPVLPGLLEATRVETQAAAMAEAERASVEASKASAAVATTVAAAAVVWTWFGEGGRRMLSARLAEGASERGVPHVYIVPVRVTTCVGRWEVAGGTMEVVMAAPSSTFGLP